MKRRRAHRWCVISERFRPWQKKYKCVLSAPTTNVGCAPNCSYKDLQKGERETRQEEAKWNLRVLWYTHSRDLVRRNALYPVTRASLPRVNHVVAEKMFRSNAFLFCMVHRIYSGNSLALVISILCQFGKPQRYFIFCVYFSALWFEWLP
jgi:hypothetical protein